jgi:hypothetical protein
MGSERRVFRVVREAVAIRERPQAPHPMVSQHITLSLDEARAVLRLVDAAKECADWHMNQGQKHITDVRLWEAVTGRERRAQSLASEIPAALPEGERDEGR